jgi:hypothetical protein
VQLIDYKWLGAIILAQNWERAEIQASMCLWTRQGGHALPEDQSSGLSRDHKTNLMLSLLLLYPLCSSCGSLSFTFCQPSIRDYMIKTG